MKYLFIIPALNAGGAERVMVTLANEFAKKGYQVDIMTLNNGDSFYSINENVRVHGLNVNISSNRFVRLITVPYKEMVRVIKMHRLINEIAPDILISFLFTTNIFSILLRLISKVPLIISERNDPSAYNIVVRRICSMLYPLADCVVYQSDNVSKMYSRVPEKKRKIIPNPINEESIPSRIPLTRKKRIVAVGRLIPQKNFYMLIDSFKAIIEKFPEYTLEIYGEGYLRNSIEEKIKKLDLVGRVKLMGVKKNVMHCISDSELFVMSSNFEGFPNVLVEAMASGIPVISTDFPSGIAREYINDYKNGLLVPVNKIDEMANAMETILADKELQKVMIDNNITIRSELSRDKIVAQWEDTIKGILIIPK